MNDTTETYPQYPDSRLDYDDEEDAETEQAPAPHGISTDNLVLIGRAAAAAYLASQHTAAMHLNADTPRAFLRRAVEADAAATIAAEASIEQAMDESASRPVRLYAEAAENALHKIIETACKLQERNRSKPEAWQ